MKSGGYKQGQQSETARRVAERDRQLAEQAARALDDQIDHATANDEGWQPPRCATCGHASGDHQSPRSMNPLASPPRGLCRVPGCGCKRFEKDAA